MDGNLKNSYIKYDLNVPLHTSHKSKGYDLGIFGGFIGWEAFDDRFLHLKISLNLKVFLFTLISKKYRQPILAFLENNPVKILQIIMKGNLKSRK